MDQGDDGWRRTPSETEPVDNLDVASHELFDWIHQFRQHAQLSVSTPETSSVVGRVLPHLGATVEVDPECRSGPTPGPARRSIRAKGAVRQFWPTFESHHLCPC